MKNKLTVIVLVGLLVLLPLQQSARPSRSSFGVDFPRYVVPGTRLEPLEEVWLVWHRDIALRQIYGGSWAIIHEL